MKFTNAIFVMTTYLAGIGIAPAAERFPDIGRVYNTLDASYLVYRCTTADLKTMDCEFTQTSVRRKLSEEEAVKRFEQARAKFPSDPIATPKECEQSEAQGLSLILQGKKPWPAEAEGISKLRPREKETVYQFLKLKVSYCRDPSIENYMKGISWVVDRDKRTCLVYSRRFDQKFRRLDANTWTVIPEPYGACGVVDLSRFELEKSSSGYPFWNYFARKAVTNPNAEGGLMSCKELDQQEYKYQWEQRNPDLNCEYVEFSPF